MYLQALVSVVVLSIGQATVLSQDSDSQQCVLLKNGQVIEGRVENNEQQTIVFKSSGSRILFDRSKVACVCSSRSEVYWRKCAALNATDAESHLSLFEWCLRNELLTEAQNQIDLLQLMDLPPSRLNSANQRLIAAVNEDSVKRAREDYERQFAISELPPVIRADSHVRQVNFNEPLKTKTLVLPAFKLTPTRKQLEDTTGSLHPETVTMYKRKVEPLIINSCLTSKCHTSDADEMPLIVVSKSTSVPKRMSQLNLYHILQYTDVNQPLESKLLAAAVKPHADQTEPAIKVDSKQFELLRIWLTAISSKPGQHHEIPDHFYVDEKPDSESVKEKQPAGNEPERAPDIVGVAEIPKLPKTPSKKPGESTRSNPKDPFDPEVFNRRFLKQEPKKKD